MAKIIASYQVELDAVCTSQQSLLVLSGEDIPALLNVPLNHIALLNRQQKKYIQYFFSLIKKMSKDVIYWLKSIKMLCLER
ncbi:hypothetical protein [sulfur-oxidizing endosymbiont of Gigantopelta aegis]|uniref:hypothetical protein n=1 Tax=sulfur-oxidizing endosymbiont of Gigantopelta aegis TaxID=2794934 RepID=UPI0018DBD0A3|nr:hypothetical protein [sulfur-oxidizing endosymbiont of Gigantopelta aegis]